MLAMSSRPVKSIREKFPPPWRVVRTPGGYRVADAKGFNLVYISGENEEVRRSILNLPTGGEAKALAKAIAQLPELMMTMKPQGSPCMSTEGLEFLESWIEKNVTKEVKDSVHGDAGSLAIELAERYIMDTDQRGLRLQTQVRHQL